MAGAKKEAGNMAGWHVHYDHVKYAKNKDSRMNFKGRSKRQVQAHVRNFGPLADQRGYDDVMYWIRKNL